MIQCPRCKRILHNGKYVNAHTKKIIPGAHFRLCYDCQEILNKSLID